MSDMISIPRFVYEQLQRDSENLRIVLEEKYEVMSYFPLTGGYKAINYVSKASDGLRQVIKDMHDCYEFQNKMLKEKYPQFFSSKK